MYTQKNISFWKGIYKKKKKKKIVSSFIEFQLNLW